MVMTQKTIKGKFAAKIEEVFSLDLRSLALFRIGLAWVILSDLILRFGDIQIFYSDEGVLPRTAAIEQFLNPWYWSVHLISGQPFVQALLFGLAIFLAFLLLVGYRTKLVAIALWAMTISLHNRNLALLFAGDDALRAILFWAMFLPLGGSYSLDRALDSSSKPLPKRVLSFATAALMVQLCFIYMFSAWFKHQSPIWSSEGNAIYYALHFDQYATAFDGFLLAFSWLLTPLTFVVLWFEWLGPLMLFIPFRNSFFRCLAIVLFIFLHLGFGLFFEIGIFPLLCISTWLAFIPSGVWDALARRVSNKERTNLRLYYRDRDNFARKILQIFCTFLVLPDTPLLALQDNPSLYGDISRRSAWLAEDWQEKQHFQWEAVVYLVSLSPVFRFLALLLTWKPLMAVGTKIYQTFAARPRLIGRLTSPLKYRPLRVRSSPFVNALSLLLLVLVTLWNVRSFANHYAFLKRTTTVDRAVRRVANSKTLQQLDWLSRLTRLDQSWSIFAPNPPRDDGWHVIVGRLKDGSEVDVLHEGDSVSWQKPTIAQRNALYRNMQWRTYFINLNRAIGKKLYPYYGRYLCQQWNAKHPGNKQLESLQIYFMQERTVSPDQTQPVETTLPWEQSCAPPSQEERSP